MAKEKKEVASGWLHHATEDSVCLVINSKEYKDRLKDGWHKLMSEVLKERKLLEEAQADEIEGLSPITDLTNEELGDLYDSCDAELVKRGLLESSEEEKGKKDDK